MKSINEWRRNQSNLSPFNCKHLSFKHLNDGHQHMVSWVSNVFTVDRTTCTIRLKTKIYNLYAYCRCGAKSSMSSSAPNTHFHRFFEKGIFFFFLKCNIWKYLEVRAFNKSKIQFALFALRQMQTCPWLLHSYCYTCERASHCQNELSFSSVFFRAHFEALYTHTISYVSPKKSGTRKTNQKEKKVIYGKSSWHDITNYIFLYLATIIIILRECEPQTRRERERESEKDEYKANVWVSMI